MLRKRRVERVSITWSVNLRCLVTGGLGVVGASVVRELLNAGHDPITLDTREDTTLVADIADSFERRSGDIRDIEALERLVVGIDAVAHLAALLPSDADPYAGYAVNALGPIGVFEAARRGGVQRVVFTSAKAVYGELSGRHGYPTYDPVPESHPRVTLPSAPVYSASKRLAEEAARHYAELFDLQVITLRFATIYGPGKQSRHGGTGLLSRIVERAVVGEPTAIPRGGDERDELVYVRDVARAIVVSCLAEAPRSWVYNIGSGELVTLGEYGTLVSEEVAPVRITVGPGRDPFGIGLMYGVLEATCAAEELGFHPAYDLRSGLRDYARHLRDLGTGGALR